MSPEEFRTYVRVAREEGVSAFELGDFKVSLAKAAFVPKPAPQPTQTPFEKALEQKMTTDPMQAGEDEDLFASAGAP